MPRKAARGGPRRGAQRRRESPTERANLGAQPRCLGRRQGQRAASTPVTTTIPISTLYRAAHSTASEAPTARRNAHSLHTGAHRGNCTIRTTTRRRHAVKQLLMLQNPPITRREGTTRTEQPGHHAWERLQRPRPRQLNHHERSLGSATPPAAPASDVPTRRVTGPQRNWLSGHRPRATTHPDRKPTSG